MSVNDLIVQGAKPLLFLDYISINKIDLKKLKSIIKGIVNGCEQSECELVGGETAEMPGTYEKDKFDIAGFAVGVVSKNKKVIETVLKFAQARLSPPTYAQIASEAALDTPKSYFSEVINEYVERRNVLIKELKKINKLIVITRSENGSLAILNNEIINCESVKVEKILDLTGAGDLFASGFFKEYLDHSDIKKCLQAGSELAANIIQKIGARLN